MIPYRQSASMFGSEEIEVAKAVLDSGLLTMGKNVSLFEEAFAEWVGAKHAVMVNSGSSANLLAVDLMLRRTCGDVPWKVGDEVLVPALAWSTTVWPLVQLGLVPVFCDVDPDTLALSLASAETVIGPRTRGMFLIHVQGLVPDMESYRSFCEKYRLTLLEDSCETIGGHWREQHTGTFGLVGTFSAFFSHHICTIEGGIVVTSDDSLVDDLRSMRAHGWSRDRSDRAGWARAHPEIDDRFLFVMPGYNVRPTEIQGAIGRVQVRKLDLMMTLREDRARTIVGLVPPWLRVVGHDRLPLKRISHRSRRSRTHSWMSVMLMLEPGAPMDLTVLRERLQSSGVETRPIIAGNLTRHPAMSRIMYRQAKSLTCCDDVLSRGLMVGCHPYPVEGSVETLSSALISLGEI